MTAATNILRSQFSHDVEGLSTPLQVEYGKAIHKDFLQFYPKATQSKHYVQILNTGRNHWVTCVVPKGVLILVLFSPNFSPLLIINI